jgi:hypothetical protein
MGRVLRLAAFLTAGLLAILPPVGYTVLVTVRGKSNGLYGDYWQGFMGNWLATVIGLVGGLPIALLLNRAAERAADRRRIAQETAAHRMQLRRLYQVVERELQDNVGDLRAASQGTTPRMHFPVGRWDAIVAGGEVRLIDDLGTLESLAQTYEAITTVNSLAAMWLTTISSGQRSGDGATAAIHRMLVDAASDAVELVDACLPRIRTAIDSIEDPVLG